MEDTASPKTGTTVLELAELLHQHKGGRVTALDLTQIGSWTDYFIIVTATSSTHMRGLMKHVKEFIFERNMEILGKHSGGDDDDWSLVDCGNFVVHVMSERARSFYELEKLWFQAPAIYSKAD